MTNSQLPNQQEIPFDAPESSLEGLTPLEARIVNILFRKSGTDISGSFKNPAILSGAALSQPILDDGTAVAIQFAQEHGIPGAYVLADEDEAPSNDNRNTYGALFVRVSSPGAITPRRGGAEPTVSDARRNAAVYRKHTS